MNKWNKVTDHLLLLVKDENLPKDVRWYINESDDGNWEGFTTEELETILKFMVDMSLVLSVTTKEERVL